jgi:F0F1-type ATP synthase membrane subunit b/b'
MIEIAAKKHCDEMRQRAHATFQQRVEASKARLRENLEAIRIVEELDRNTDPLKKGVHYDPPEAMTIVKAVRFIILNQIDNQFSVRVICRILERRYPEIADNTSLASLSSTIRRVVADSDKVKIISIGKGRRPTIYQCLW